MCRQVGAEDLCDGDGASAGGTFGCDDRAARVHRSADMDHASGEVDVVPSQGAELAAAQASIERRRPQRALTYRAARRAAPPIPAARGRGRAGCEQLEGRGWHTG